MANISAWFNEALARFRAGDLAGAEQRLLRLLGKKPRHLPGLHMLGTVRLHGKQYDAAVTCFRKVLARDSGDPATHLNLGIALRELGRFDEAEACYRKAIALAPNMVEAHQSLGNLLARLRRYEQAEVSYRAALKLAPTSAELHYNMGNTYAEQKRFNDAERHYRHAIAYNPEHVSAYFNLGSTIQEQGDSAETESLFLKALKLDPWHKPSNINLLLLQNYLPDRLPEQVLALHKAWGDKALSLVPPGASGHGPVDADPERPLRVGYLSPDFRAHQVADFFEPVLLNHDTATVFTVCYANVTDEDEVTERMKGAAGAWRDVSEMPDAAVADLVRADRIDILVDLAGHTRGSRLDVLAYCPAPVQATYVGYPGTTGLSTVAYRFTDAWADPAGSDGHYTEQLVRLPSGFCCWRPPDEAPEVAPTPLLREGAVTFGCLLPLIKLNDQVLTLWARLLEALPDARLLVFRDYLIYDDMRERYLEAFRRNGVPLDRVILKGDKVQGKSHLAVYHEVDIVLDTLPYAGHTTTCEALWMGVPVVTLAGDRFAGRMGVSIMHMLDLPELICETPDAYLDTCQSLAGNPERLDALRQSMRDRMRASRLCDGARFTGELEAAYRDLWRTWCASHP